MIEYWKKIFKESWMAYINNLRLMIGAIFLSFSPIVLTIFIPDSLWLNIDPNESTLIQILKSIDISIIIFLISIAVLIMILLLGA